MVMAGHLLFETTKETTTDHLKPNDREDSEEREYPDMNEWQKALFLFTTFDIAAGAIANLTCGTSRFHANNDDGNARLNEFKFACVHFLHAGGIYYSCVDKSGLRDEWNKSLFIFLLKCYLGQLLASSIVINQMGFDYQRIIGWTLSMLMMSNVVLDKSMQKRPSLKCIMSIYAFKLIYAFSVDHDRVYK